MIFYTAWRARQAAEIARREASTRQIEAMAAWIDAVAAATRGMADAVRSKEIESIVLATWIMQELNSDYERLRTTK